MTVVPHFILKRIYVSGSLRAEGSGVAFDIKNSIGPGTLTKINSIGINGIHYHANQIQFKVDDQLINAVDISDTTPATFFLNQTITCLVDGVNLAPGAHTLTVDLLSKEAGKIVITVQDKILSTPV